MTAVGIKQPRVVYIDKTELETVVRAKITTWKNGGYKHIVANRKRILKKPFKAWQRAIKCLWLREKDSPTENEAGANTFVTTPDSHEQPYEDAEESYTAEEI